MCGSTGGFDHQPYDRPSFFKATWWSITKLTIDENPNVTRMPNRRRHSANAITNPENEKKQNKSIKLSK